MEDMDNIREIYSCARAFMAANGNPSQWGSTYPPDELICADIDAHITYIIEENGHAGGLFVFGPGPDPDYAHIYDGSWLSDSPYGVIHRVAGNGTMHGLVPLITQYCAAVMPHLRADTHADNIPMQHQLEKCGFIRCGTVYIRGGSPRIAFEKLP